jgi:hypothetical protein
MWLCWAAILAIASGGSAPVSCLLNVRSTIIPPVKGATIALHDGKKIYECSPIAAGHCKVDLPRGLARTFTIVVEAPGYQIFRRTFLDIGCGREANVSLGEVKLIESNLPKVEQVIFSLSANGNQRFEFVLSNRNQRSLLIKTIRIEASRIVQASSMTGDPCGDLFASYEIDSKIDIRAGRAKRAVSGKFRNLSRSRDYEVALKGVAMGLCGIDGIDEADLLYLEMPTAIVLPLNEFAFIILDLPSKFRVNGASVHTSIGGFTYFVFKFTSDDHDAGEIKVEYEVSSE